MRRYLYADDIYIWASGSFIFVIQQQLQEGIDAALLKERRMGLSPCKNAVLPFTLKHLKGLCLSIRVHPIDIKRFY